MTSWPLLPILAAIVGLMGYLLSARPKGQEIGRIIFFVGFFWLIASLLGWRGPITPLDVSRARLAGASHACS